MLSRPEVGTREHILLWLASKDPDEVFHWYDQCKCACGQYGKEHGINWFENPALHASLNVLARDLALRPHDDMRSGNGFCTFGDLYEAAREAWSL